MNYDKIYEIVRGSGWVTRGQADEITVLLVAALATPQPPAASQPSEATRIADLIDPLTRKSLDNLTLSTAAKFLRSLAATQPPAASQPKDSK